MRNPTHYPEAGDLYRALTRVMDPERYDVKAKDLYDPEEYGIKRDTETRETIAAFLSWLAHTPSGHGLTSEAHAAFQARVALGVSVRMDQGAVVIRVPRAKMEKVEFPPRVG